MASTAAKTVVASMADYIAAQPPAARRVLQRVRTIIQKALPEAEDVISYSIPAFKIDGRVVVFFAGWKEHFSIYPATGAVATTFKKELSEYVVTKGTIRFPWADPIPARLIAGVAKLRARDVADRAKAKTKTFDRTYLAPNLIVAAAGNIEHEALKALIEKAFADVPRGVKAAPDAAPAIAPGIVVRQKDIEQSHIVLGTRCYPQAHEDRHTLYILNTILGGSMSSRLFQHIREERGLAYAVFSNLMTHSDTGALTVYAGCAVDKVGEVIDLTLAELRGMRDEIVPAEELQRAKDHLKGSLMLSLENTSSRMSQLARQEMCFERHFTLDELLKGIDAVSAADVQRVAKDLFSDGTPVVTVVGPKLETSLDASKLKG